MKAVHILFAGAALWGFAPSAHAQQCALCDDTGQRAGESEPERRITIDIDGPLDFDRIALTDRGGGEVAIDPRTGQRSVQGMLIDLGGFAVNGTAVVRGDPGRSVRVDMPNRVTLHTADGHEVELLNLHTDLPAQPRLDMNGELRFAFGGTLDVHGQNTGQFRGRIRISAEYE